MAPGQTSLAGFGSSTPFTTPKESPTPTPFSTPPSSADSTPFATPSSTPYTTAPSSPESTPYLTPSNSLTRTPYTTAPSSPDNTPYLTPLESLSTTPYTTARNSLAREDGAPARRKPEPLPKAQALQPDPDLDGVKHKLHRGKIERLTQPTLNWLSKRSTGWGTPFNSIVTEAPAGTQGRPKLAEPDDAADVPGRLGEIRRRTQDIAARLDAADGEPQAPVNRKSKKGLGSYLKSCFLGAKPLTGLVDNVRTGGKRPPVVQLAENIRANATALRADIQRLAGEIETADAEWRHARDSVRQAGFANREQLRTDADQKLRTLKRLHVEQQARLDVYEAADFNDRLDHHAGALGRVAFAKEEMSRYQAEIAKLVGSAIAGLPADAVWRQLLQGLDAPLNRLQDNLYLDVAGGAGGRITVQPTPATPPLLQTQLATLSDKTEGAARAMGRLHVTALHGPNAPAEHALRLAEDVVRATESVYLEISSILKAEARALRISTSHVERLEARLDDDNVQDPGRLLAALAEARKMRDAADLNTTVLRQARTELKQDIGGIRDTYQQLAELMPRDAVLRTNQQPELGLAVAALDAAEEVHTAATDRRVAIDAARAERSQAKKDAKQTERGRLDTAVQRPMGFSTAPAPGLADLRAALLVAANGLDVKRTGTELSASTVIQSVSQALAQVTGGDPARAARAANALTTHSLTHWLGPVGGASSSAGPDEATLDVLALHKMMSTMPRGMEVLARLSLEPIDRAKRDNVAANRGTVSALRVHWLAAHELERTPDAASRAWLQDAKATATRTLHEKLAPSGTDAAALRALPALTERQKAAFNGVRNGYLSVAPNSPFARANEMLDRLVSDWTVAPDRYAVPLDENLSSRQIREAAATLLDFVAAVPQDQRSPQDAVLTAFAQFGQANQYLHATTPLTDQHIFQLSQLTLQLAGPAAGAAGAAAALPPEPVFREGMTFAAALDSAARFVNRLHGEPAGLKEALEPFKPGRGLRERSAFTKLGERAGAAASSTFSWGSNPLNRHAMRQLNTMSSGLGMNTRTRIAAEQMQAVLDKLGAAARNAGREDIAIVSDGLRRIGTSGDAVDGRMSRAYAHALQGKLDIARAQALAAAPHGAWPAHEVRTDIGLHQYATDLLAELVTAGTPAAPMLSDDERADLQDALQSIRALTLNPDLQTVKTLGDMADVFTQFVSEDELRDKRKVFNGQEFGLAVPVMPWATGIPFAALARYGYKREAVLEVGMYINLAEVRTHRGDLGASVGWTDAVDAGKRVDSYNMGLGGGLSGSVERQEVSTLSLRLPRQRGTEEKLRRQVPQIMRDLAEYAAMPPQARAQTSAVEVLLGRHHDLAIALSDSQGAWTKTVDGRLNLGTFGQRPDDDEKTDAGFGGTMLGVAGSLEYAHEWKKETVGAFVTRDETASVKANLGLDMGVRMPIKVDDHELDTDPGRLRAPGIALAGVSGFRNFLQRLDKTQISIATSEGATIDADTDEFAFSPNAVLQELQEHREAWLERGLNTLMKRSPAPCRPHERETVGRRLAEAELAQFEDAIQGMGKTNKFTQFNINYSLNDSAKGLLGDIRLQQELARAAGQQAKVDKLEQAYLELLKDAASWEPNKVMARVKAKVPSTLGIDFILKARKTFQVEGQRVPWQYPA